MIYRLDPLSGSLSATSDDSRAMNYSVDLDNPLAEIDAQLDSLESDSTTTDSTATDSYSKTQSLAVLWARKYYVSVMSRKEAEQTTSLPSLTDIASDAGRCQTAERLLKNLSLAAAQAWSMTEQLLAHEIQAHDIHPDLINPLQIAADSKELFQKALNAYTEGVTPRRLSVLIGGESGRIRQKYTADDPRAIGFVSMQFHYTGKVLLDWLSMPERFLFEPYLKVMDDHMYMPLRDAYRAAADHPLNSPMLRAVQHLLPLSSKIARTVCHKIWRINPGYESYSGALSSEFVKTSSIRDVEMFQVYLCLCVLEDSICSVQRELFPLCVMLSPPLKVQWKLVQDMLQALTWEMVDCLDSKDMGIFIPYLRLLGDMFSKEVFQNPS